LPRNIRLYARVGAALIAARECKQDFFTAVIPWDRFRASVAEASALARSEEFDPYQLLREHYAGVRRWTPAFWATFTFQGVPAAASLLRAIGMLSKSAPTGFMRERWARHVLPGGAIDRRYYELCVLSELRKLQRGPGARFRGWLLVAACAPSLQYTAPKPPRTVAICPRPSRSPTC
jgi:hypothetical protein